MDCGEHRESDRASHRLHPCLCRGCGFGQEGDEGEGAQGGCLDVLAEPCRHRVDAPAQPPLHGCQLCRGADSALLQGA